MPAEKSEKTVEKTELRPIDDRVAIYIPKDGTSNEEAKFVSVNGYTAQIRYGEDVYVPRFVAEVIKNSNRAARVSEITIQRAQAEFNKMP